MSVAVQQCAWAMGLVAELCRRGVTRAIIAPGSRHTPLVLAAHNLAKAGHLEIYDVLDERVAGFVALGLGRVTGEPAMVLTTSGTAGAHLLPAVIEAERSRVPMLLITADRPQHLHGVGAPQTIEQRDLFGVHARLSVAADPLGKTTSAAELAGQVMNVTTGEEPGPVHLNVPFEKPLWEPGADPAGPKQLTRRHGDHDTRSLLSADELASLARTLTGAERGLIFAGPGDPGHANGRYETRRDDLTRAARRLAETLDWPLVADGASAVRLCGRDDNLVTSVESLVRSGELDEVHPDVILQVGQTATSTAIQKWLGSRSSRLIPLDPSGRRQDPAQISEAPRTTDPALTLEALVDLVETRREPSPWGERWRALERIARSALDEATEDGQAWSGAVVRAVLDRLPEAGLLHVASSLPIRDLDAFSGAPVRRLHVAANRGANGIDGLISTALGEALTWRGPVVALIGDLAFAHDLSGLAAARELLETRADTSLTLVVVDNGGGAIFDGLPIAAHPTAHEPHFVTPQRLVATQIAEALGLETRSVKGTRRAVSTALDEILETPGLKVLHVQLDRHEDAQRRALAHGRVQEALLSATDGSEVTR